MFFKGENIAGVGPVALAKRGMARTFQLVQIFPQLTVAETIAAAVVSQQDKQWRLFSAAVRRCGSRARASRRSPASSGCEHRLRQPRRACSRKARRSCWTWRPPLRSNPEVILLDEPTSGVSTAEKHG